MNVSVIIPVYNAEKFIEKAINSCLQLEEVKEIIVIDDAFPDHAYKICQKLANKEPKIKLFTHPNRENRGAGPSRNLGLEKATQDYIAFLDADDFYLPNRFEKDQQTFRKYEDCEGSYNAIGSFFYSDSAKDLFEDSGVPEITSVNAKIQPTPNNVFDGLIGKIQGYGYFSLVGLTVKKEALDAHKIKFDESLPLFEDTDFIIRLAYHCSLYPSEIEEPVALRGVHEENRITHVTKDLQRKNKNRFRMWNSLFQWSKKESMSMEYQNYLKKKRDIYNALSFEKKNVFSFLHLVLFNKEVFQSVYFPNLFKSYFKNIPFSHVLYKILIKFRP